MIGNLSAAFLGVVGTDLTPVVFTLTLDDLSTRFAEYDGAAASIKFKLTATNGGGALTTASFVYLDSSQGSGNAANTLDAVGDVATLIQTQLNALSGYSGVTVNGVATVPGDQWDFTITFPGGLGVTNLAFHASSQWYPTVALIEAVTQQGVAPVTPEIHTITPSPVDPTGGYWKPAGLGADIEHHAIESEIENQIVGGAAISVTASGTLDAGVVTINFPNNEDLSDTFLSPVNTSLTAPEITHSIT